MNTPTPMLKDIVRLCQSVERGLAENRSMLDDADLEQLVELGDHARYIRSLAQGLIEARRIDDDLNARERAPDGDDYNRLFGAIGGYLPPSARPKFSHPDICPGYRILSIDGERDSDEEGGERFTGPGAIGIVINSSESTDGVSMRQYNVVFTNGTSVIIEDAELATQPYRVL